MNIHDTKDAALALAALITDGLKANSDGKITAFEAVALLGGNASKLIAAAKGIGNVPAELMDLDPIELEELYLTLIDALALENDNEARHKVGAIYDLLLQSLVTFRAFAPNKAQIVADVGEPFPLDSDGTRIA